MIKIEVDDASAADLEKLQGIIAATTDHEFDRSKILGAVLVGLDLRLDDDATGNTRSALVQTGKLNPRSVMENLGLLHGLKLSLGYVPHSIQVSMSNPGPATGNNPSPEEIKAAQDRAWSGMIPRT